MHGEYEVIRARIVNKEIPRSAKEVLSTFDLCSRSVSVGSFEFVM